MQKTNLHEPAVKRLEGVVISAFPGKYIQGEGVIARLPEFMRSFGGRGLILASRTAKERVLAKYVGEYAGEGIVVEEFGGECCEEELERLLQIVVSNGVDVLAGVGGGKAIDTAKIVADRAGIPVIIVPTIASTDAPCSGCAVIYTRGGVFHSVYYQIDLPTSLAEIGLANIDQDKLMKVAIKACDPKEGIHHEPTQITPQKVLNAILAVGSTR